MPIIEEIDSGIDATSAENSREDSPTTKKTEIANMIEDDPDIDETLSERLWGLTEMFPETLRNVTSSIVYGSLSGVKSLYGFSRSAVWVFFTTSAILVAPVVFEVERMNLEEEQKKQQRQILLGPSAAISGGQHMGMPPPTLRPTMEPR